MSYGVALLNYVFEFIVLVIAFINCYFWRQYIKNKKLDNVFPVIIAFILIVLPICIYSQIGQLYMLFWSALLFGIISNAALGIYYYFHKKQTKDPYTNLVGITAEDIIENLPGHVYWKSDNGVCLGCNRNQYMDVGLTDKTQYIGKTDYELFTKEQADSLTLVDKEILVTGKQVTAEEMSRIADGSEALYLSYKVPIRDNGNHIVGILGFSSDITNAKKQEIERKEFLENIISLVPGHVYWLDLNCVYMGCNDAQAKSAGLSSRQEIVGKRNKDLPWNYHTEIPELLDKVNVEVMKTGIAQTYEEPAASLDGTKGVFLSSKIPLRGKSNEVIGLLGISVDITYLKKIEEDLRDAIEKGEKADKLKLDFIHNMEHDIRTPFNGVYSLALLLAKEETDPTKKYRLEKISECGKQLLDYCNAILDFSNVEINSSSIRYKRFNLKEMLSNVVAMEGATAAYKNITLALHYPDEAPFILLGDDIRMQRIMLNLTSNAVKFTENGNVDIIVSVVKQDQVQREVILKIIVADTGIGISDDKKDIIFEKFIKLSPSNKGKYRGIGLGLYVVKQFVTDLNGDMDLVSALGKGTAFACTIPFKIPHDIVAV